MGLAEFMEPGFNQERSLVQRLANAVSKTPECVYASLHPSDKLQELVEGIRQFITAVANITGNLTDRAYYTD